MMIDVMLAGLVAIMVYMTLIWVASLLMHNAGIVDVFWGPGFVLAGWVYFFLTPQGYAPRKYLILAMVTIWGLRLGWHLARRNFGKAEDYRYANWRASYGKAWWWRSFFQVFILQGLLMWIIATPLLVAQYGSEPAALTLLDGLGVVVWLVGFIFESVGDWQLKHFKADPTNKGKVLRTGLWQYTRHPNYFGDACVWWGHFGVALSVPGGWVVVFAPVLMTFLLMRVSGVTLLERKLKKTRPEYADYVESTNAFFPGLPRKK